jgi:hypothetical protein
MPAGFNPGNNTWGKLVTTHQMSAIIAVLAVVFLICVERGFRGLKIDIS